jgi:ribosomal protein L29
MKKTDKISYTQKSISELQKSLFDLQKKLIDLKIKQSTGNLKDTSLLAKTRYEIALIKTLINQSQKV